jgi:DNA replication protein DnaD
MNGLIKLHRKVTESPVFQDPFLFRLWTICLMKAAHKPTKQLVDKTEIQLLPGQFITGRFALEQEYNRGLKPKQKVPGTTLWSWLKRLETWGNLNIESNNKFSIVTLVNWDFYQGKEEEPDNNFDSYLTATCQQPVTNKNLRIKELKDLSSSSITVGDGREIVFFTSPIDTYRHYFVYEPQSTQLNLLNSYLDDGIEMAAIAWAMDECKLKGKGWDYCMGILNQFINTGVRTAEQAEKKKQEHEAAKVAMQQGKVVPIRKEDTDEKREGNPSKPRYDYGF